MSDTIAKKPKRASLWREGLRLFRRNLQAWFGWAVWFFIAFALFQALFMVHMSGPGFAAIIDQVNQARDADRDLTPDERMGLVNLAVQTALFLAPLIAGFILQGYAYQVFFMKQQPGIGSPKLSVGRFFYLIWVYLQLFVIKMIAALVLIEVPFIAGFMFGKTVPFALPVAAIVGLIGFGVFLLISFRLALAPTLAVCAAKPVLKNSWTLMKENCWRLFWNAVAIFLVLILLVIAVVLVQLVAGMGFALVAQAVFAHIAPDPDAAARSFMARYFHPTVGSVDEQIVIYIGLVFDAVKICLINGVLAAFYCAVVRVFYEEKQADDPAFKLVTSP